MRLWELKASSERKRSAIEVQLPPRHGQPARFVALGEMATCPLNNVPDVPPRALVMTPIGPQIFEPRRRVRADGTRAGWSQPTAQARVLAAPSMAAFKAARADVRAALASASGQLVLSPNHRVRADRLLCGRVLVIPSPKGAAVRYASVDDVANALALGIL